ncbi:MAG: DUF4258 domain-containing protein [Nitrosomonadales bacterium]|nr:DUF4258 domain-containing protein [Nitrosomonadales bacterium]
MDCQTLHFSRHAFERMFQRGINPGAVARMVAGAEVIVEYPDDQPFPSALLLGFYGKQPVHAVVAREPATGNCHLVTIYWPDPIIWDESFKKRRA